MIRRLSVEYVHMSHLAEDRDCPAPYAEEAVTERETLAVALSLRDTLRGMAGK